MSQENKPQSKTGFFRKGMRGVHWLGQGFSVFLPWQRIRRSGETIASLYASIRRPPADAYGIVLRDDGRFDLEATAKRYQGSIEDVEYLLRHRREETRKAAYCAFLFGWIAFGGWFYRALTLSWQPSMIIPMFAFFPFCLAFFLVAFRNGLLNYQLRMRRFAGALDYLMAEDGFWPC